MKMPNLFLKSSVMYDDENSDISKESGKRNNSSNTKSYVLVIVFITPTTNTVTLMLV
jgi:hypothetical protein